ncbi:malic acid transport protein [Desulfocucumis palustris]|uniref:Malic acid transport protein n=1 Tax=Desulfocucumis palustris TaxID=1898651 RepID=A0A2L2XJF9_9FIRM|nr:tellurite-resistance/dicarboxylate transporter [Desulfocucumis palustris]GBF34396.1 malic acid transport protein [Desulfocucumis palustris]
MNKISLIIKNFAPSWFASVMGTGIVAITSFFYSRHWAWLQDLSVALLVFNLLLFGVLLVPWLLRIVCYPGESVRNLREPVTGQFYATMPIACLVLAADLLIIGVQHLDTGLVVHLAKGFWVTGVVLALVLAVATPLLNFVNREVKLEQVNPAWFMPPVSLIVIPVPGARLISYWPDGWQQLLLVFNYVSWSGGFFLFLFLEAICLYRFFCRPPLPGPLAPTAWINLGPIGVGTIALFNLGAASAPFWGGQVLPMISLLALLLWGFGFWWLICALVLTIYYIRQGSLPFSLAWWAFTFPLGAYTAATYLIASYIKLPAIDLYGFICYLLLLAIWSVVMVRTVLGLIKMEFF